MRKSDNAFVRHATLIDESRNSADVDNGANNGKFMNQKYSNCNETRVGRIDKRSESVQNVVLFYPIVSQCGSNI